MSVGKNKRLRHQAVKRASPGGEHTPPEQIRKELLYHVFHYIIEKPEND